MRVAETKLPGLLLIEPRVLEDKRGHFLECYHSSRYADFGIPARFVQDNLSFSIRNVLRGMHYQLGQPQGKLVMVVQGAIYDVCADIRRSSSTFGQWFGVVLSSENYRQIYVPKGFCHGFCVLSATAMVLYKCTDYYAPTEERGIRWDDASLAIDWPIKDPILSEKDAMLPSLRDLTSDQLPL